MRSFPTIESLLLLTSSLCLESLSLAVPVSQVPCTTPKNCDRAAGIEFSEKPATFNIIQSRTSPAPVIRSIDIENVLSLTSFSLAFRNEFTDLLASSYKTIFLKTSSIINTIFAGPAYEEMYLGFLNKTYEPSGNELMTFVRNAVLTLGALEIRFDNLPLQPDIGRVLIRNFLLSMIALMGLGTVFGDFSVAAMGTNGIVFATLVVVNARVGDGLRRIGG